MSWKRKTLIKWYYSAHLPNNLRVIQQLITLLMSHEYKNRERYDSKLAVNCITRY